MTSLLLKMMSFISTLDEQNGWQTIKTEHKDNTFGAEIRQIPPVAYLIQKIPPMPHLLLLLFCCCLSGLFAQGPISGFRQELGTTALAITYSQERYDQYFNAQGKEDRALEATSYSLFIEAATGPKTSLVATLPYIRTNNQNAGLQDASLWIKYLNLQKVQTRSLHNVFTAVGLSFPIGNYPIDNPAAIGQKASVFQTRLVYQFQHEQGWFLNAASGIDFQFSPSGQAAIPLLLRTGYGGPYFYVEAWWELVSAINGQNAGTNLALAGTASSWSRLGATLYVPLRPWLGITLGGAWILSGQHIGQSSRLNIGSVFQL